MFDERDRKYFYDEFKNNGYEVGSYDDFKKDLNNKEDRDWYYNEAKNMGYDVGTQSDFDKMVMEPAASTSSDNKQVAASAMPQSAGQGASAEGKQQVAKPVAQPVAKPVAEKPKEDNRSWLTKWMTGTLPEEEEQETAGKEPGLIAKALNMIPTGVKTSNGTYQPAPAVPQPTVKGEEMPVEVETTPSSSPVAEASPETKEEVPVTASAAVVNNDGLMDAKLANYIENWKQRPDKEGDYFENMVADLLADGTANSNEEAVGMVKSALGRYANRSAMDVTNQVVSSLPDDTVQDAEKSIEAQWYSHGVQDKLKQEADSMGISYDDYVGQFLKPAMVQSLVNKYGPNYRDIAEGIATRLYSHDEHVQDRLMNQDIDEALSGVINKYVNPSVVDEYNKAQEAGSKAFTEGMDGSQYIPANLRLGTALGAQFEANEAKDPAKVLSGLQKKFGNLYRNPEFLNDMSNAAFKVMQRYGLNGGMTGDPKQFKPMINSVLKNELDQLEIKGMMPQGSAEYIMKTGLGNTIVGKITRKAVQTDYQNWLEDMANQQYQPGFWENVASGALTFAGDAWSYWLPGAAGGKLTKSMLAKAEGKLAGDLMAKGMERRVAERAAKVLIGKSKAAALKNGAVHGAVTFGGQSAISKPIDEVYRTGQFDENGKVYSPSVGKIIADTLGEVTKQSAVGAIMQGGTIANMIGKGRGLATNILADIGGKVADSGIMTGHQILERMAQDPNFKPTGKDAAESFLESMANLTAIGLPGMMGKYARFKDAREFNKKFDFTDQDIAELKRFGYDGLRDTFEKVGIGEYAVAGENAQRLDGQLTQKYMNLMNDKSVPEVLKAKMMAVVEGKRPSSFSPVVDSIIVQPMDHDGKVYLETLNKDGGIIDRKEFSSLAEAQKADKKLEYEKTLGLASVLEGEFHKEFTQEHLDGLYNKAAQKYNMGEKLTDEDKAAVYLHQNAGAIKDIMDKQQKGVILTDEEQKQVNAYRHYYDSALENSSVMREFVNTFEDSHGVARGTLRKALESKDKKYAPLVESYLMELYNSIELKREMKQTMDDLYNTAHGNEQKRIEQSGIEGEKPAAPVEGSAPVEGTSSVEGAAGGQEPPVSEGPAPYQDRTNSVPSPSDANSAANVANSSVEVATSDAFVMGQEAYKNGDSKALQAIDYNSDLATGRLKRAFKDSDNMFDLVTKVYNEGRDMEQFLSQRASLLTSAQKEAIRKYVEAMDAKKGAIDALQHADDGYDEALKQQLWPYQTEDGNIVPATLTSGRQVFLKKANEYGGGFVVVPDEQGQPTIKQVSDAEIKEVGTPVPLDEYIESSLAQQKEARAQQFISQFDGSGLKPNDRVAVAMEEGDENIDMTFAGYSEDGKIVLSDGKDYLPLSKEEFAAWRTNALNNTINERLDREDEEREQKAVSQAEADKKQRYANGIVGLSEGQPDYSSKDTDPNVAAEYLQEQFREDHGKLLNLVNGSRDDIETQLANKKKAAAEYQNWLDTNADLDPEKAQKVENDLALVNEQIADLDARFKNWNAIRNSVMTPDEVKAMKEERKAEVEKAGVDETAIVPSDDFHLLVLDDKELKKQYPTMDEANDYITSQRKVVYHTQEDVEHKMNDVNDMLEQYINGETELDPNQLMELNTTKAQLEAQQTNLSVVAKGLKAQANKLSKLYKTEVSQQEMKELGMTPSEQRKVLVSDAIKKNDLGAIKEIYKDASVDVTDLTPQTLEEAVSESLSPHSLNPESLQYELGKSNFKFGIGKRYDSNKFNYLIAKKGTGMSVNEFAVRVYNDLPVNLQDMGYTDQDVRNALLDMFKSYDSVKEMRNVALMNRIAAAEDELSSEEEFYEAQKEREIIERQAENPDYYAYLEDNSVPLPSENELNHIAGMEYDHMMEIEDREREYKQYVKSILPELADYDDRSNEEGYGGGSSLGSDSSRRGVDEGNRNSQEGGSREASAETETGALHNSTGEGRQEISSLASGEGSADRTPHLSQEASFGERLIFKIPSPESKMVDSGNGTAKLVSINNIESTGVKVRKPESQDIVGLERHPRQEIADVIANYFIDKLADEGINVSIEGLDFLGSRVRHTAWPDDDLDVVIEYKGLYPEQIVSKIFEQGEAKLEDIDIHIIPIHEQESGSLREYVKKSQELDDEYMKNFGFPTRLEYEKRKIADDISEAQKKAGNYKKGHLSFGGFDFTIETPQGVTRSGKDEQGKPWSVTMHDTYGYILGKIGVDGDHIDMFINDAENLDTFDGNVYVVDQVNPETGEFDEHKVMYGYPSEEAATEAYLANYSKGWKGLGKVTAVSKATFDKWLETSDRKTKPFSEYVMIRKNIAHENNDFFALLELNDIDKIHPYTIEDKNVFLHLVERVLSSHNEKEDRFEEGYSSLYSLVNANKLQKKEYDLFKNTINYYSGYRDGVFWIDANNSCAYEIIPKYKDKGETLSSVVVRKLVPLTSFHRDVKEVKPSEMTEAQKVAYDAVSTMLKKAGIPVKVVSNEDMEKVAEAQDNLNLAMLLNQPEMRFKIKTPEEKKAAENAYNFAKELRPDKWKQYAVVDMSNPNKMPEYFEKQELARKERSYYNKLMWGNFKVFNLDKSFEDNVAGLTGSFPSEFDPYKIDAQTSKKNELKKQMKETEEAYKLTGQERNNYQIQLMKEYMDEHGLASENDIPDDVWSDLNDKAHKKYQDKLDSLFAKYKDLDRQLKAIVQPGVRFLRTYHGTGASFDKFDLSHALEGEGSETFGHGVYVTSSSEIGREYAQRAKQKKMANLYKTIRYPDGVKGDALKRRLFGEMVNDVATGGDVASAKEFAKKRVGADANDVERTLEHLKDREKGTEYEQNLKNGLAKYKDALKWIDSLDDDYLTQGNATRYEVEIPDDNGSNYLDWEKTLNEEQINAIRDALAKKGVDVSSWEKRGFKLDLPFKDVYAAVLPMMMRYKPEYISQFLSSVGFTGIKYPAGMIYGGAKEDDYNYVIFDENNANIVGNTKFAQGKGVVYGYTDGKKIVLNQEHLNANTPIHEYQHLWRTAAKRMNPELIAHGDELIKQTQLFRDLKEDPNYKHLSDDEICDEAFARLTGEDGAAILEQMAKEAIKENPLDTAKELTIINRLKNWLKKFWYWTLDTFTKWKPEDIKKMTLEDIRNLVLRDLANGVDPRTVLNEKKAKKDDKTLAGVHNITEEKLRKALKLGGLANPSLAVIDTSKSAHDNFGEISFIAPSALVDKRTGKTGGTWITDAYTQRYPSVEREMSEKGYRKFKDWVASLDYPSGAKAEIERQAKDALSDNNAPAWELMYLKEKGIDIKEYDSNINDYRWKEIISDHPTAEDILNSMKTDPELNKKVTSLAKYAIIRPTMDKISLEVRRKIYKETGVKKSPISPIVRQQTKEIFERDYKASLLNKDGSPRKKDVKKVVEDIVKEHNDTKKYDFYLSKVKASNYVNKNGLYDDYIRWQENKLDEFGTKNRIFRGYKNDGTRKYVPETLENVSKVMREEADGQTNGSEYTSFGSFIAKLASRVDSTDEMRANKDKLSSNKDKEEFYEKWESVYYDLAKSLYNDVFYGEQRLHDIVSQADPKKYAKKEYGITLSSSFMKKLDALKNAVQNDLKSAYFETKFNRPVHLNEFVAAVVPNNLGEDVRKGLEESGLSLYDYDPEKEGDRKRAFNEAINSNYEIRFHRVTEPEELERLNKEKTFRMYSGMQEVDGKLYSPMAAIIDGKRTDATEIGAWMGADERPDLVKGGKFQLVKTDKNPGAGEGPVRAAYNPYMHTSTSMMNDQFTGAYARGNIKVVEWEIPESEKTSGYHAEGAKDAVGLVPWHSGSVNGLLPKDRQRSVMLSRWRKAVRVVPDAEVAESIAEQLEGTGLAIPWNVVTPNQVRELVKLGVPITTVESGQQAPETKEKFMAQMEELRKEFPQAQFVNVKMTKDAFKEWGKKAHVKARLVESFEKEKARIASDAKEKGSYMLAPNGKKSKLDAEQWATVRTTNFKKWFGDWENDPENASKVVDENGEPMVVYHGRSADFNTFEKKEGVRFIMGLEDKVKAEGFFFSPDRALAEEFAGNAARHRGGKANVVPCYLNIRKPMDLTGEDYDRIYEDVTGWDYTVGMDTQDNLWGIMDEEGMADKIKAKGYDGAIFVEEVDDNYEPTKISYCALDANQIKSADKNNGEFSSRNNDIRFRFGEPYDYEKYPLGRVEPNLATKEVKIVHTDANHGFKDYKEAKNWAKQNIAKVYTKEETGEKGEVRISNGAIDKFLSQSAVDKSETKDVHLSVLKVLPQVLKESIDAETHPDFLKGDNGKRSAENGMNKDVLVHRCYGAVDIDGNVYRVKITLKEDLRDKSFPHVTHSYEATKIELLAGTWENPSKSPSPNTNSSQIEPLEAIDAQVQDHGSHSNDSISGTNLLKKVEMSYDKGKKLLDESEKMGISIENQRKIADSVVNTANKLGGAEATVYSSLDDVPEEYRSEVEQGAKGWYDPETHTVHVYLPNCEDGNDAQRTVFHEKIGHEGLEVLLGGEDEVRKFANFVYNSVAASTRGKILEIANEYDPDWKKHDRMNVGTQEYIARLAEEGPKTAEDFSLWTKIKHYLIKVLKKLGVRVPGLLNDKDLRYYLMKAGKALHVWDDMPETQQEAMMKQASNAEIKDSLGEGAGKGKPRQKKGESMIQYMKRVQEWRKWKDAREDENDPEPPMFYDIDKDEAGKKEWELLNKKWRDRHHLAGEEPTGMPIRMKGETDDAYMTRIHDYEKWKDAMKDEEDPIPDMFDFEKSKQEEVKRKYEDWLARHELLEQQQADLDLYEGKIYPAETNPKADDLEQQVMQDLAEVTSTDVSKEGAARSVHDAVIYRRKNIESASADDAIFINSVKQELNKMANASYLGRKADAIADAVKETVTGKSPKTQAKKMAEAIPYIIEAPRRMRDIADEMNAVGAFENGHIHVTAKDIDAIQPFTEELRDLASKNHKVDKDGKETIVYDDVPSMTEVAGKMAKAINDNHVGEDGFVPVDGTDILAEHVLPVVLKRIVPKGIEYKNLSEEMQSLLDKIREWYDKTFTWLKDSHTVREDIGYTADYVNHRWDKEKSDDKAYADLVEGRQRTKSPNEKPRKVSTYMEGVDAGLVPKTTDITDLLAYYSQSNIEAFANKAFLQELSGINVIERDKDGEITSSMPLLSSIQPKEMMVDENKYTPYVVPGINTVWVYNQGKIFNKSAEDWFNAAFGTVKLSKILKGIKNAMSIAKTLELGFSGFHAGALSEVYAVQNSAEFGPAKAMAYFMKYLIADTAKNHQLPTFANPEVFKEAAKHLVKFGSASDYATADIENLYDKVHSYVAKLHSKLVEGNVAMKAGSSVTFPLEVATELLRMSQKGLDVALWSYLHDGLKLATYQLRAERTRERAKKLNWDEDMLNKALDEDGQFVNDMFGGQHFDVLGISKKMQTILDFIFLSKDWLISTTRHALSIFGYGSIWNEASIKNFWEYYKHVLGKGEMTKEDYLRLSRSKSGLLCYGVGFMIGYEGLSQLVNAAMRAWDEEKQKEKADEIRKTNPSYKSPYELAYPDGMHWYDYLMRGNSLGQQSKIFMGRYADGTEMYIRHGKQFREIPELFFDAKDNFAIPGPMVRRMYGKSSPLLRGMIDTYKWYLSPDYGDKEMQRKYGENLGLIPKLASYYVPFAVPTQKDKEFKMLDLVFPSSKGFSRYKAQDYFKTFIMSEDKQGLAMTYNACVLNGIDAEAQIKAAIGSVKALESAEMKDGVTSLQVACQRFDAAKSITEKKKMRQKMKKFLSMSDYKAFTQKEALDMVQGYLNGEEDLKEMEKADSKYLMAAKAEDVTEDWRIQNAWNGTMEAYEEYQRLKDIDKAKANAFKNSKTNKRLFAARKAISAAKRKMNKAKKQMDGTNGAAKMVEIRKTRKELLEKLNGME